MLLDVTQKRNAALIQAAVDMHLSGRIPPNTYVIDLEAVEANARCLADASRATGVELYFVSKQFGRNPLVIQAIARHLRRGTGIDAQEAFRICESGAALGNVGHLVQIPEALIWEILRLRPAVVTVFSFEKAASVSRAAGSLGFVQPILLRVCGADDYVFPGQEGGIPLAALADVGCRIQRDLGGVRIAGITSFPCLNFDPGRGEFAATANFETLTRARRVLDSAGIEVTHVNAPSGTCVSTLPLLKHLGATHAEPGHALTGSTPLHAVRHDEPEIPAMVYVSEVSHLLEDGRVAVFGGGFYRRGNVHSGLVVTSRGPSVRLRAEDLDPTCIDYYRLLAAPDEPGSVRVGDPVVFAFRTQVFVTTSRVAVVSGARRSRPELAGLFDAVGNAV